MGTSVAIAILALDPDQRWSIMFVAGRAVQNMVLEGRHHGLGSVMATIYELESARELLMFPDDCHIRVVISFVYPLEDPLQHPARKEGRQSIDEVVRWDTW